MFFVLFQLLFIFEVYFFVRPLRNKFIKQGGQAGLKIYLTLR